MRTVYKYPIQENRHGFALEIPFTAKFLYVHLQQAAPYAWFEVSLDEVLTRREFVIIGTGSPIPEYAKYLGTYLSEYQNFVWHLYELVKI